MIRKTLFGTSLLATLCLAAPLPAAEVTEVVEFLHAAIDASFTAQQVGGDIIEFTGTAADEGTERGIRSDEKQFTTARLRFGAYHDLELFVEGKYVTWDITRWRNIDFGSDAENEGLQSETEKRKGLGDIKFGLKYAILNADRDPSDFSNWLVGLAVRADTALWKPYPDQELGAPDAPVGTGGIDITFSTAFSKPFALGTAEPYASFSYESRGTRQIGSYNFDPGDIMATFFGFEIVAFERPLDGLKLAADIGVGWSWQIKGETFSNRFLYPVTDDTKSYPSVVTEQGHGAYTARMGFAYQIQSHMRIRSYAYLTHKSAHFIEEYSGEWDDIHNGSQLRNMGFIEFRYVLGFVFTI